MTDAKHTRLEHDLRRCQHINTQLAQQLRQAHELSAVQDQAIEHLTMANASLSKALSALVDCRQRTPANANRIEQDCCD